MFACFKTLESGILLVGTLGCSTFGLCHQMIGDMVL